MFKIFESKYTENNGVIRPPEFELVKRVYDYQIDHIVNYYRDNVKFIPNQHLLVRMLNLFMPSLDYDLEAFIGIVYARSPYVAKHFRLTSEIETGSFFEDLFYMGHNLVIYDEEYFNPYEVTKNWKTAQSVKVLKHPISNLMFLLPAPSRYPTIESGLSVVKVNLPMLLVQYREFLMNEMLKPEGTRGGAQAFVARYVLPNMIYSHADIAIFNRFYNNYYKLPVVDTEASKHPFMVIDYSRRIDRVASTLLKYIANRQMPYYGYLKLIPSIYKEDAQEALQMGSFIKTRRNWWALYLARLDEMCFLYDVGGDVGKYRNRDLLAKARIDISRLLNEHIYGTVLPIDMVEVTEIKLNKLLNA